MQRILVAYASKSGTAKEVAEQIAADLQNSELVNLAKETPKLENYNAAIIGGGVRIATVHKATKHFIDANVATLEKIPAAYFITHCFYDDIEEIIGKMLPAELRTKALFAGSVGGRLNMDELKGIDKLIAKAAKKSAGEDKQIATKLDTEAIQTIVVKVHAAL